jgi:eukaryotic-like serine/threonine-protein kinase
MPTCPSCNEKPAPGAVFCGSCGARLLPDPALEQVDPFIGQTVGGVYLIREKIGSGGMGDVYKAIHRTLDAPVAVKIVKRGLLSAHPSMLNRFQREARAASRLRHPNVVSVTDFGQTEDGTLFMVMEYVTGRTLARVIAEDGPLTERRVVHIGAQILAALAEAHAHHILHRDLKPENVMIEARRDAPDAVKVLDFGIAKLLAVGAAASTFTQAGLVCGTPGYMSPEQLRGDEVDARSDLFSVGVVLYEMLTHKLPFEVQTPMEMLHKQLSEAIPSPSSRRGRPISPRLEALVLGALSPSPDDRPPGADEMRAHLVELVASIPAFGDPDADPHPPTEVLPRPSPVRPSSMRPQTPARAHGTPAGASPPPLPPQRRSGSAIRAASRAGPPRSRTDASRIAAMLRTPTTAPDRAWDPAFLQRLEERVGPLIGPVAPHLVRKISLRAGSIEGLCQVLATFIPSQSDQDRFLAWSRGLSTTGQTRRAKTPPAVTPPASFDPAVLERAQRQLAVHLGPMAAILVRRVASRARDPHELYELLSREIPSETEREVFRRLAPSAADPPFDQR